MTNLQTDPYGYDGMDVYTFDVNFDNKKGLQLQRSRPQPAPHPHLEGIKPGVYYCVVDPSTAAPDGFQPFTIFGPYLTENAAQSVIDDRSASSEAVVVRMFHTHDINP